MRTVVLGVTAALLSVVAFDGRRTPVSAEAPSVVGLWLDHEGKAAVEIARCDRNLCGKIVWLKEPNDKDGKPWADILNADVSKRMTPICGLPIISDLKRETNGEWTGGWIYDPEQGRRFNVEVLPKDDKSITIFAFDKERARSETMVWTRLPDNSPRCK